jgi:transposase InsO family protein
VPETITSDNGSEFAGQAMGYWAHQTGVKLDFIRPGKPVENSYIEKRDYNQQRPHRALADRTAQLSFGLSVAERPKEPTQDAVCVEELK